MGWLDNAARQSRLNRLRRASYKLPLQVPAAKIVIDDPFELKYEAASCCCKDSVLTKVLTKVLLVDVHPTTWIDPRSRWTSEEIGDSVPRATRHTGSYQRVLSRPLAYLRHSSSRCVAVRCAVR